MMKTIRLSGVFFCFVVVLFLCSCGFFEAQENKAKLSNVWIGMTRAEVKKVMGEPPKGVFQTKDVYFYYTDPKWYDGSITRDECTPFVFSPDEDRLVGFGYDYYRKHCSLPIYCEPRMDEDKEAMRNYLIQKSR